MKASIVAVVLALGLAGAALYDASGEMDETAISGILDKALRSPVLFLHWVPQLQFRSCYRLVTLIAFNCGRL